MVEMNKARKTDWELYWNASHKFTPTLPLVPTHSLLLWRPLFLFTPPLCCGGVLFTSHSYTATLFPYFWVDTVHWVEMSVVEEADMEEEEEEEAPCLAWSDHISDHAEIVIRPHMRAKLCRWNYVIFVHRKLRQDIYIYILQSLLQSL